MRGKPIIKKPIQPDEVYASSAVSKLINYVMLDGKKNTARKIVYSALEELGRETKVKPVEALEKALQSVMPTLEIRSRRVGGANYQIPMPVRGDRQMALAFKWIIEAARKNRGAKEFYKALACELAGAYKGEGAAVKKREDTERMADANRVFAQFAW
jgi:small subunit ribosomal protein S7